MRGQLRRIRTRARAGAAAAGAALLVLASLLRPIAAAAEGLATARSIVSSWPRGAFRSRVGGREPTCGGGGGPPSTPVPLPPSTAVPPTTGNGFCVQNAPCWPSDADWAALSANVSGRLVAVSPAGAPCFTEPNSQACADMRANDEDTFWLAAQPGAMQVRNWEVDQATGEACFADSPPPCKLGNLAPLAVRVGAESDVAAALAFARERRVRIAVRSTGHDYHGRSTAPGALLIWMHPYKGIEFTDQFSACPGQVAPVARAVTCRAGNVWGEVNSALRGSPWVAVGGFAQSVGCAGGWLSGGGHSYMSTAHGLGVDNVLRIRAALADGTVVTASPCSNPELFWALRGGGGGTFAVVTEATYRLYPAQSTVGATLSFQANLAGMKSFLDGLLKLLPSFLTPDGGGGVWGGYFTLGPQLAFCPAGSVCGQFVLVFNGPRSAADAAIQPLLNVVGGSNSASYGGSITRTFYGTTQHASFLAWRESLDGSAAAVVYSLFDTVGFDIGVVQASRLVPRSAGQNDAERAAAVEAISSLASSGTVDGLLVVGGRVSTADSGSAETSLHPTWRDAVLHLTVRLPWPPESGPNSKARREAVLQAVSARGEPLRRAFPGAGAYLNEADYLEADWQSVFWGTNYGRLQAAKAQFDPTGLFSCHHCVELPPRAVQSPRAPEDAPAAQVQQPARPLTPLQSLGFSC